MAFGRRAEEESDTGGRYFVDHVPIMISGKKFLQTVLDQGDAKGWELVWIASSDKNGWMLIVWDRSKAPPIPPPH